MDDQGAVAIGQGELRSLAELTPRLDLEHLPQVDAPLARLMRAIRAV